MAKTNGLVIDGGEIKFRLEAEREASTNIVHVDWLRFTVLLRNVVPSFGTLPDWSPNAGTKLERRLASVTFGSEAYRDLGTGEDVATFVDPSSLFQARVIRSTVESFEAEHRDPQFQGACSQAYDLAREVAQVLGKDFIVNTQLKAGQDFYKYRFSIERVGHECAWVGFLASGNGQAKAAQDQSIHVNIQGHACTFAEQGWREKMADVIDLHRGKITRADLAVDFFDGLGFDFARLLEDYRADLFKVRGKNPACNLAGDWANGSARSMYVGSRQSGKITNVYEKGDALFGVKAQSPWVRIELRYGDQLRVLPTEILRTPDSFFAGASDWHEVMLSAAGSQRVATPLRCHKALEQQTVVAEVTRNLRWLRDAAKATVVGALTFMDYDTLLQFIDPAQNLLPGRLKKFAKAELSTAYTKVIDSFNTVGSAPARFQIAA